MHRNSIDRKGILAYLFITFGTTYAIEFALAAAGFRAHGLPQAFGQVIIAEGKKQPADFNAF